MIMLPKRHCCGFSDPNQPVKNKAHMCSQETPNSLRPDFFEIRRALGWMGLLQVPANLGFRWGGRGIPPSYHRFTSSFGRWAIYNTAGFSGAEPRLSESTAGKRFKTLPEAQRTQGIESET